jgi:hypothetical protein
MITRAADKSKSTYGTHKTAKQQQNSLRRIPTSQGEREASQNLIQEGATPEPVGSILCRQEQEGPAHDSLPQEVAQQQTRRQQ